MSDQPGIIDHLLAAAYTTERRLTGDTSMTNAEARILAHGILDGNGNSGLLIDSYGEDVQDTYAFGYQLGATLRDAGHNLNDWAQLAILRTAKEWPTTTR